MTQHVQWSTLLVEMAGRERQVIVLILGIYGLPNRIHFRGNGRGKSRRKTSIWKCLWSPTLPEDEETKRHMLFGMEGEEVAWLLLTWLFVLLY